MSVGTAERLVSLGVCVVATIGLLFAAAARPFWNDELYTYSLVRLPSLSDTFSALRTGAEQLPPAYYVLTRGVAAVLGTSEWALRVVSILSLVVASYCVYRAVTTLSHRAYGVLGGLVLWLTAARYYGGEARPYALVLALAATAVVSWQAAIRPSRKWFPVAGLGVSIALAVSFHYYACLLIFPFALAELVRTIQNRRVDWPVAIALVLSLLPLVAALPFVAAGRDFSTKFWAEPKLADGLEFYSWLLPRALRLGLGALLVAFIVWLAVRDGHRTVTPGEAGRVFSPGWYTAILCVGFLLLPLAGAILGVAVTGAFTFRYALAAVLGVAILAPLMLSALCANRPWVATPLAALLFVGVLLVVRDDVSHSRRERASLRSQLDTLAAQQPSHLPVVVDDPHHFFVASHYADEGLAPRLTYLADPDRALRAVGTDSVDRGLLAMAPYAAIRVEHYQPYIASGREFLLVVGQGGWGWVSEELRDTRRLEEPRTSAPGPAVVHVRG